MEDQQAQTGIKTIPTGKTFIGYAVVRKKELKSKQSGEPYLLLELGDWSGRLKARIWDKPLSIFDSLQVGNVVKIKAVAQTYQNQRELKILKIRKANDRDQIDPETLLPKSTKNIFELQNKFFEHIQSINNPHLKRLLSEFFLDESFARQYFTVPAGKLWHHNYLFGMLEHVVAMLDMSEVMFAHYPEVNLDLLKTGIILHDIGKVEDFTIENFIEYSDKGRLLGHIAGGFEFVSRKIDQIENFPDHLKTEILHMILSHQGEIEKGSAVPPMTLEAIILNQLDLLDSMANAVTRILEKDVLEGANWSKFVPLLERFIYKRNEMGEDES